MNERELTDLARRYATQLSVILAAAEQAEDKINSDDTANRQLILEGLIAAITRTVRF